MGIQLIDFNSSFITWLTKDNSFGRFNIEALCSFNNKDKTANTNYLCSTVMAGNVYGKEDLFKTPSYTFSIIFSENKFKRLRFYQSTDEFKNDTALNTTVFQTVNISAKYCEYKKLNSVNEIVNACEANSGLITVINNGDSTITFPVKHINFNRISNAFQVETGYLIHNTNGSLNINDLELFNIAFNSFDKYELLQKNNNNSGKTYKGEISVYAKI
ncbi:MAG: hypothetical protein ABIP51_22030 [Bacteroidia bacterium]